MSTGPVIRAVGGIVVDESGRLLLIRRGRDPGAGAWSVPGGRLEPGEDDAAALRREMREETGVEVAVEGLVGEVTRAGPGVTYLIRDYRCRIVAGTPVAGSDAAEVGWFAPDEVAALPLVPELAETLREWQVL